MKLGKALQPLLSEDDCNTGLLLYDSVYSATYLELMRTKMGLVALEDRVETDRELIASFFSSLASCGTDFTEAFQALTAFVARADVANESNSKWLADTLTEISTSPEEMVGMLSRKMKISRLSMPPEQIEFIWDLLETNPAKIEVS